MKKTIILIIAIILISFTSKNNNKTHSLTIVVNNLRNSKGVLQVAIYNTKGSIPDQKYQKYYKKEQTQITLNKATITFSNLPEGTYAVNILHDENKNGKIDKKRLLPSEGIGFSNYTSIGLFNRPNFSKASFLLTKNLEKEVKIIYL